MSKAIFWHRRDLRITDNAGLYKACQSATHVQPVFIFDTQILNELEPTDARVEFIHRELERLATEYVAIYERLLAAEKNSEITVQPNRLLSMFEHRVLRRSPSSHK